MSDINIILLTYSRTEYLLEQLQSLEHQTVKDRIVLHIINNNVNLKKEFLKIISRFDGLRINFVQKDNSRICFERFYYVRDALLDQNPEFVIFIDDDQIYAEDQIEKLVSYYEPNTFCTWYGRQFDKNKDSSEWYTKTPQYCFNNSYPDIKLYDYGGPGFSIIDCSIFDKESPLWDFEKWEDLDNYIPYSMDDVMLSWTISRLTNWKIKRSFMPPSKIYTDKKAISKPLNKSGSKSNFVTYLNNKKSFHV